MPWCGRVGGYVACRVGGTWHTGEAGTGSRRHRECKIEGLDMVLVAVLLVPPFPDPTRHPGGRGDQFGAVGDSHLGLALDLI